MNELVANNLKGMVSAQLRAGMVYEAVETAALVPAGQDRDATYDAIIAALIANDFDTLMYTFEIAAARGRVLTGDEMDALLKKLCAQGFVASAEHAAKLLGRRLSDSEVHQLIASSRNSDDAAALLHLASCLSMLAEHDDVIERIIKLDIDNGHLDAALEHAKQCRRTLRTDEYEAIVVAAGKKGFLGVMEKAAAACGRSLVVAEIEEAVRLAIPPAVQTPITAIAIVLRYLPKPAGDEYLATAMAKSLERGLLERCQTLAEMRGSALSVDELRMVATVRFGGMHHRMTEAVAAICKVSDLAERAALIGSLLPAYVDGLEKAAIQKDETLAFYELVKTMAPGPVMDAALKAVIMPLSRIGQHQLVFEALCLISYALSPAELDKLVAYV